MAGTASAGTSRHGCRPSSGPRLRGRASETHGHHDDVATMPRMRSGRARRGPRRPPTPSSPSRSRSRSGVASRPRETAATRFHSPGSMSPASHGAIRGQKNFHVGTISCASAGEQRKWARPRPTTPPPAAPLGTARCVHVPHCPPPGSCPRDAVERAGRAPEPSHPARGDVADVVRRALDTKRSGYAPVARRAGCA